MHRSVSGARGALLVSCLFVAACTAVPGSSQAVVEPTATEAPTPAPTPTPPPTLPNTGPSTSPDVAPTTSPSPSGDPTKPIFPAFDASKFSNGATITNEWLPLQPGRRWIEDGVTIEDGERIPHRIAFTVTNLTKRIEGIPTVVAYVEDYAGGELVEKEIAFYAQDDDGAVWYFGEHPEEFEDGDFVDAPTWIAGIAGAKPGIKVIADPSKQTQAMYQGWGPKVDWDDYGVLDVHQDQDCVTAGCFDDVYRFAESSDQEPGVYQLKSYAKGVGEIRTGARGGGDSQEDLQLKSKAILKGAALEKFDDLALGMEAHAYKINPGVYGKTEKMQ
jgi:hypothetical protein